MTFRALLVDRDAMSTGLLADALARNLMCDATATRSSDLLRTLKAGSTELVIISTDLGPKVDAGYDLAKAVFGFYPEIPIILLLDHPGQEAVVRAFRSGALGVYNRQEPMTEFFDCVEHVRRGFIWAGKEEARSFLENFRSLSDPSSIADENLKSLTSRELQVVQCAAKGKSNKGIASEMGLSEHTVKNYLFRAFKKLGVTSRVEALLYLTNQGVQESMRG